MDHAAASAGIRVAHLTSAHPRDDTRIFHKECKSLARHGYEVALIVADGLGDGAVEGITVLDAGVAGTGRMRRVLGATRRVLARALALDADIYHLHDPELLPVGLSLKGKGKQVVFDAHEDLPQQLLNKPYLHASVRRAASPVVAVAERWLCRRLDGVVAATPTIRDKFLAMGIGCVDVNNYPIVGELTPPGPWSERHRQFCYVGSIGATRGIRELVAACERVSPGTRMALAGVFSEAALEAEVRRMPGWTQVDALGSLDRSGVRAVLGRSKAGLVTLHPTPAYLDALPVKMFEYMAAGVPVIASDFPLWRRIVEEADCGLCVDPLDPSAIARAIDALLADDDRARRMGENGQRAVADRYNWDVEEGKLLAFYRGLSGGAVSGRA